MSGIDLQNLEAGSAIAEANRALAQARGAPSRYQNYTPRGGGRRRRVRRQIVFDDDDDAQMDVVGGAVNQPESKQNKSQLHSDPFSHRFGA